MDIVLRTGSLFMVPIRAKLSVSLECELDPLKVSSKALLTFLNVVCF